MATLRVSARRGFTFVELIVVVSIMAVLAALSLAAILKFTGGAQKSATRTTLFRLDSMLRKQITTTNDRARKQTVPDFVTVLAGGDDQRATVIWMKLKLKQKYPVTFAEVYAPAPGYLTAVPAYVEYLRQYGVNPGNAALFTREAQSAACLLMALRVGPDAIGEDELSMGGSVKEHEFTVVAPAQGPPVRVPVLVDAWNNPVLFCRWPVGNQGGQTAAGTGSSALYPAGYAAGYTDPSDPSNLLLVSAQQWQGRPIFEQLLHRLPAQRPAANQAKPMVLSPVIVSAGADELMGVDLQTLQSLGADSDDNIYSVEVR